MGAPHKTGRVIVHCSEVCFPCFAQFQRRRTAGPLRNPRKAVQRVASSYFIEVDSVLFRCRMPVRFNLHQAFLSWHWFCPHVRFAALSHGRRACDGPP